VGDIGDMRARPQINGYAKWQDAKLRAQSEDIYRDHNEVSKTVGDPSNQVDNAQSATIRWLGYHI
jgi:hypothetical protein